MKREKRLLCGAVVLAMAAGVLTPAGATTLIRQGLDELVAGNRASPLQEATPAARPDEKVAG